MTWQVLDPVLADGLPRKVRHWLDIRSSVSAEIERVTRAPMTVEVIRHADAPLLPDEAGLIEPGLGPATVREVVLWAAGHPRVVARTVFTAPKLRQDQALQSLGARPLGALLFAGPEAGPFTHRDVARIGSDMPDLYNLVRGQLARAEPFFWARRTLFWLQAAPILCTEVFLPDLLAVTA